MSKQDVVVENHVVRRFQLVLWQTIIIFILHGSESEESVEVESPTMIVYQTLYDLLLGSC